MDELEYPRVMYRPGNAWQLESGKFDLLIVEDVAQAGAALTDGWRLDQYGADGMDDAAEGASADTDSEAEPVAADAPTRVELETRAKSLGLTWHHKTGDKKLAEMIAAAS